MFSACQRKQADNTAQVLISDSLQQDSILRQKRLHDSLYHDSAFTARLTKVGEPDLKTINKQAYRYIYARSFLDVAFIFTVLVDSQNNAVLHSKTVGAKPDRDTLLESVSQQLSTQQTEAFLEILDGSYYWALNEPYPNGSGFLDGDNLSLESKTNKENFRILKYHYVSIHVPFKGSFKDACTYLAKISKLKQSAAVVKYLEEK